MIRQQKGFTLVEALLALLITGVLFLLSFPPFLKLYDHIKLNQAIALLQSDLNYIRQANMMPLQGGAYTLRIYHKQNSYVLRQGGVDLQTRVFPTGVFIPPVSKSEQEELIFVIQTKQKGYVLIECLIGLVVLSTVGISLTHSLPKLLNQQQHLETQQTIYYKLYELNDRLHFEPDTLSLPLHLTTPIPYTISQSEAQLCATYQWRDVGEQTLCL